MRKGIQLALLGLIAFLPGCFGSPATSVSLHKNEQTGQLDFDLHRAWLSGPVNAKAELTKPDGTHVVVSWGSDVDLQPAVDNNANMAGVLNKMVDRIPVSGAAPAVAAPVALPVKTPAVVPAASEEAAPPALPDEEPVDPEPPAEDPPSSDP